eukprot:245376-Prorocentrum_minimum.AAC.3
MQRAFFWCQQLETYCIFNSGTEEKTAHQSHVRANPKTLSRPKQHPPHTCSLVQEWSPHAGSFVKKLLTMHFGYPYAFTGF